MFTGAPSYRIPLHPSSPGLGYPAPLDRSSQPPVTWQCPGQCLLSCIVPTNSIFFLTAQADSFLWDHKKKKKKESSHISILGLSILGLTTPVYIPNTGESAANRQDLFHVTWERLTNTSYYLCPCSAPPDRGTASDHLVSPL